MARPLGTILTCSLLAAGAIAFWLWQRDADPAPAATPAPPAPAVARGGDAEQVVTDAPAPDAPSAAAERTAAPAAAAGAPAVAPAEDGVRIHGTITVVDARGVAHPTASGTLQLAVLTPRDAEVSTYEEQPVTVTAGTWETTVPRAASKVSVHGVELDGRGALCSDEFELKTPERPIAFAARWLEPLSLRVLGDDSGTDLGDLRVVRMTDWRLADLPHPGNSNVHEVLAHAVSPLRIEHKSRGKEERFWIRAPGYAWNQIDLVTTEPGERVLRLLPGGDVDVTIVGAVPPGSVLRARPVRDGATARPVAELHPDADGTTRVDGLPAGSWTISLEKGSWYDKRVVAGETTATITTGTITTATITIQQAPERPPLLAIGGTLRVSPHWGTDLRLDIQPTGAVCAWHDESTRIALANMKATGDGEYRWGPRPLLAGRYELTVHGTEHRVIVHVGPEHPTEIAIAVPDPNEVRVRIFDATDGQPLANAKPGWYGMLEGWQSGWSHAPMQEQGDGWYSFRAPAGNIQITLHPDGYVWSMTPYVVQPGSNQLEVRINRVCGVEVVLKDGETVLPWPDDARVELEHVITKAGVAYWSGNKVAAKEPGEHTLTLNAPDGFLPIPPRRVQIEPAKWTVVEISLQRK